MAFNLPDLFANLAELNHFAAAASVVPCQPPLLHLPGEIRNRIYDYALGSKTLHVVPQIYGAMPSSNLGYPSIPLTCRSGGNKNIGLYNVRQTFRQIAEETKHFLFQALELSRIDSSIYGRRSVDTQLHYGKFKATMKNRWQHVRHLTIHSFHMNEWAFECQSQLPDFPLPGVTIHNWGMNKKAQIIWPADTRNLTTITIHDMNRRTSAVREMILKILTHYFPKLEDVRCSYDGDEGCMRRYRITSEGELKWWYTGELFKKLPGRPSSEEWFDGSYKHREIMTASLE